MNSVMMGGWSDALQHGCARRSARSHIAHLKTPRSTHRVYHYWKSAKLLQKKCMKWKKSCSSRMLHLLLLLLTLVLVTSRSVPRTPILKKSANLLGKNASRRGTFTKVISSTIDAEERGESQQSAQFRVITDIDDTIKSSGGKSIFGVYLGGIDTQFKRGTFYPGAFQFAWELSKYNKVVREAAVPRVAVLTARAREFKFALALKPTTKIVQAFHGTGVRMGMKDWGIGDVLYGSVVEWIFQDRKGKRKFDNFEILLAKDERGMETQRKQHQYIFVGDTGEMDEDAGLAMIKKYPDRMKALFLHKVADTDDHVSITVPKDRHVKGVPVIYYRTYVGAAVKAYKAGVLDRAGMRRVVKTAKSDLRRIDPPPRGKSFGTTSAWNDLQVDLRAAQLATSLASDPFKYGA